ncbi:MAG: AAA family ATPase [Solirubrobacteraceae bacterium]
MTLVALSAAYGAGGERIGRALAQRLGVPFVDRAIPAQVATRLAVPFDDAQAHDEQASAGLLERMLSGFIGQDSGTPAALPAATASSDGFRSAAEAVLHAAAATGEGVLLGRAAVIVLRDDHRVLRVRLDGPAARRADQAMRRGEIDQDTAARRLRRLDRTHAAYVRHFYGVELADPSLYHVVLDSTAISIDACVDVLAIAAVSLAAIATAPREGGAADSGANDESGG